MSGLFFIYSLRDSDFGLVAFMVVLVREFLGSKNSVGWMYDVFVFDFLV